MVETAAHLTDHVLPPLPVRQWVLSVPKRPPAYGRRQARIAHDFVRPQRLQYL
jgi:hypothetical protein